MPWPHSPSFSSKVFVEIPENKWGEAFNNTLSCCCDTMFAAFSAEQVHTVNGRL